MTAVPALPTSTYHWFYECSGITAFDGLRYLTTSKVTNMEGMFGYCTNISNLDLAYFDTRNVTTKKDMFNNCWKLTTLDVSTFNTAKVTDITNMFCECRSLTNLDLSNFNTSNVTDMSGMFTTCVSLQTLDLTSFDTHNVTTMEGMFYGCNLKGSLDLNSFDISNAESIGSMFKDCFNLTTIFCKNDWTANQNDVYAFWLFAGCDKLTGSNGTAYDDNHDDLSYAHLDGEGGMPGYFSDYTPQLVWCKDNTTLYFYKGARLRPGFEYKGHTVTASWSNTDVTESSGGVGEAYYFNRPKWYEYRHEDFSTHCTSLVGGNGTAYDSNRLNVTYARPDSNNQQGYFTSAFMYDISSAGVGTLYMDYAVNVPDADYFDVFYVRSVNSEGTLYLRKVRDVIPAKTAVVIFGNEGAYSMIKSSEGAAAIWDNMLCGVSTETSVEDLQAQHGTDIYVLSRSTDSYINFRKAGSGSSVTTIPANRAYLPYTLSSGACELAISFDEGNEATGIETIAAGSVPSTGVYTLSGQRVTNPQHGLYIVNGKKAVIK